MVGALLVRHEPTSAALVRHRLARDLARYDLTAESIDNVVLVASELVGNAIRHTRASSAGTIEVSWDVDASGVRLYVGDSSNEHPEPRATSVDEPGGRGLRIVAAVSEDWGVESGTSQGKQVWARIPVQRLRAAG